MALKDNTDTLRVILNKVNTLPDRNGNSGSGGVDVSGGDNIRLLDVVSYYQAPVSEVATEVNALSDDWVSFVAITDTHGDKNMQNSQNVIRYLLKNSKADKMFHLGDTVYSGWDTEEFNTWFTPFENCKSQTYFAIGNHDLTDITTEGKQVIYNTFFADKDYLNGDLNNYYYYFDDAEKKIRYIVLNVSITESVTSAQISWLQSVVQLPTDEWKIIAFGHVDILPNDPISSEWQVPNIENICNALSSTNGKVIGYFCGHEHHDRIEVINDTFREVILLNDKLEQNDEFVEITNPTRTPNTVTEHAISVVSANLLTGVVAIRRIGAGEDMAYNYLQKGDLGWTSGVPYAVTLITGIYIEQDGTETEYDSWSATDYLPCKGVSDITMKYSHTGESSYESEYCAFYDEDKNFICHFSINISDEDSAIPLSIVEYNGNKGLLPNGIPSNAVYVRFSHHGDYLPNYIFTPIA